MEKKKKIEKPVKEDKKKKTINIERQHDAALAQTAEPEETDAAEAVPIDVAPEQAEVMIPVPVEEAHAKSFAKSFDKQAWKPKTALGQKVKNGEITNIDEILTPGLPVLEAEIVESLLPNMNAELLLIGQSKGKFGGGKRRIFRQTQKKTMEGNKPKFAAYVVVGDENGHVGIGYGKSKETVPAREKSIRNAKKNVIVIRRGCGSWQCGCKTPHSVPFKVEGKAGSVTLRLIPAPKGTGLVIEEDCAKILKLAGIRDVVSKSFGTTPTRINMIKACEEALRQLTKTKIQHKHIQSLGIAQGSADKTVSETETQTE